MTGERVQPQRIQYRRVVVKVGSNVLTGGTDALDAETMAGIARQIGVLMRGGCQVLVVTSGAIAAGRHRLKAHHASLSERELPARDIQSRQSLAAIGQSRLMALWDGLFEQHGVTIAQALLTRRDLADRPAYLNARNTLLNLIDLRVVPIANENDVVSIEEIRDSKIGDNDNLSAQVANLVDADLLLILTDLPGLYTADPRRNPDARLIERIEKIDDAIMEAATGEPGERGTGGMATKVQAARIATGSGTHVVLADGRARDVVLRAVAGEPVGTHFLPTGDRTESRRRYLLSGLQSKGRVEVDSGAARALLAGGKSLLPAGVTGCTGEFQRGDVVTVVTSDGRALASGVSNYAGDEVRRILGKRSDQIAEVLGYEFGEEVIHRNNLVLV
ncbi:MAG: glutamate 5-kinase [Chloroflexi bacterium]|nr:glutamate 5-kinase [Chloroflexota bacterium]MDA1240856.1 glutamate 5-kinase [Chloroflexota bacterium]